MTLLGLPLATLAWLFGAFAAVTTALYILKLRRRAVAVPFAQIWDRVLRDRDNSQLFSQLRRWLSLVFQLLLLAALVLSLGDPRLASSTSSGRNVVILVDASASMKAVDVAPSRLEVAKAQVRRFVRGLGAADRAVIVQMDSLPTPLTTLSGEPSELEPAIDRIAALDTQADLGRALDFAEDTLRGLPQAEVVLVTDGALRVPAAPRPGNLPLRLIPVGEKATNVAISEFSARRYPLDKARVEVMLELDNTNDKPADVELTLLGDGLVIDVQRLRLAAGEQLPRFYPDIAGASRKLEARVKLLGDEPDVLAADDRAFALIPERRRARVLVVTPGNTYLEAALLLDEYLDVTYLAPALYPPREAFDVTVFDGVSPTPAKHTGSLLYVNPPAAGSPVGLERRIEGFGFDRWDRKHPILRFAALGDVQVAEGFRLLPGKEDRVIGESDLGPILVSGNRGGQRFVALGFDPRQSDFVLRPAWPLFVLSSIDYFVEEDSGYLSSYRTGRSFRIPAPSGVDQAELTRPDGQTSSVPVKDGRAVFFGDAAGFYTLRTAGKEPTSYAFAANLADPEESRIAPRRELGIGSQPTRLAEMGTPGVRRRFWALLLLGVAAFSVVEWFTYHRRVTV